LQLPGAIAEKVNVINLKESNLLRIREHQAGCEAGLRVLTRVNEAKAALTYVLENGYDHWIVTFSGGKDSTCSVVIALETALEHPGEVKRIDVIYADTMIEIPTIHQYALSFLNNLRSLSRLEGLPLYCHVALPAVEQRFWVRLLGRGYPPPHQKFRWCTRRLKIEPIEHRLKRFVQRNRTVIVTGVRFGESKERDRRLMQSCSRGGECGQGLWFQYSSRLEAGYLAPLIDWKDCDVWDFLLFIAPGLGYQTSQLQNIYNGHQTRFGCWMCTVVRQDKAMEKTIAQPEWNHLAPLAEFRKHVWEVTRHAETRLLRKDGQPGRLRHEMRKALLERLLAVQRKVGFELISDEEIRTIKRIWREERTRKPLNIHRIKR
jgi:DNA sulfur modification protein DndC